MRVRVEHLEQPIGVGDRRPRLSWQLPEGATRQVAYELRLDGGTSTGRIAGPENVLVAWPGEPLTSRDTSCTSPGSDRRTSSAARR